MNLENGGGVREYDDVIGGGNWSICRKPTILTNFIT
jgi:hypothetical protein